MTRKALKDVPGIARLLELGHRESVVFPDLLGPMPAQVHSAGFQLQRGPSYNGNGSNPSNRGLAAIRYTLSGRARLRYYDRQIVVGPGQALLLSYPYEHHYWLQAGERWESFYVTLAGREVIRCIREVADSVGPVVTLAANSPTLARVAGACADALEQRIGSPSQGSSAAHAILMALLGECCRPAQLSECRLPAVPAFVLEVEEFCRRNYSRPVGVADLARVAKMSRFHFTRLFEKIWGISPGRYLRLVRLEHAAHLIRDDGFTAKDLARQCGFSTTHAFRKAFRKHFGVSPGGFNVDGFLPWDATTAVPGPWSGDRSHVARKPDAATVIPR